MDDNGEQYSHVLQLSGTGSMEVNSKLLSATYCKCQVHSKGGIEVQTQTPEFLDMSRENSIPSCDIMNMSTLQFTRIRIFR
jgi:hypothetical protein